jgi:phenylalanine-4-hydroxylase
MAPQLETPLLPAQPHLHGAAAGDAGRPARADWTIDQDWQRYTPQEHATWRTLFQRQSALLPGRCRLGQSRSRISSN